MVETLIYHGKLANQIARLPAIVVKFTFGLPDYVRYIEEFVISRFVISRFVISRFYSLHFTVVLAGT